MKTILFLVVILHVCYSLNTALNAEMIKELTSLKHQLRTMKHKSSGTVYLPSVYMYNHSHYCAGVFFGNLRVVLTTLLAENKCTDSVEKLLANLDSLKPLQLHDQCRMEEGSKRLPIESYIDFIRRLSV